MDILLLSTYESGHQPLGVARPAAHLRAAGHRVRCQDLAVERLDVEAVRQAELVGISVPMHTATRLGARLSERVRALNPGCHVAFYGLYASLHADVLLGRYADSAIGGEFETPLVELAERLEARGGRQESGGRLAPRPRAPASPRPSSPSPLLPPSATPVYLGRQDFQLPARDLLPPLERYARVETGAEQRVAGYVEASRGCAHRCLHCPITPVYGGRLRIVQREVVLEDIRRLVDMGAQHITFGDPDFFNGIRHSLGIVEALHAEFPELSYDVTIKVEHLLEHGSQLRRLAETGCLFIVSAVEAVQDRVLEHLHKGHTAADVEEALELVAEVGLVLRPTFVPFTPWTSARDYLELLDFVAEHGLIRHVDPVQYTIRLLIPRGSSLVGTPAVAPFLGPFDAAAFSYRWAYPDPAVDRLQAQVSTVVEQAVADQEDPVHIFGRVHALAREAARMPPKALDLAALAGLPAVPRLTEPWFC